MVAALSKPFPSINTNRDVALTFDFNLETTNFFGDQNKMQRAFLNLLGNATKFTHSGAIVIRAHTRVLTPVHGTSNLYTQAKDPGAGEKSFQDIIQDLEEVPFSEFHCQDINEKIKVIRQTQKYYTYKLPEHSGSDQIVFLFEIFDTGIGFHLPNGKISPFNQNRDGSPETRDYGGTGLGLFITDQLVQSMKGCLSMASIPKVGSLFSIALTCSTPQLSPGKTRTKKVSLSRGLPRSPKFPILIAEDNTTCQALLKAFLNKLDYTYVITGDGPEALRAFDSGNFSLILMDFHMPKVSGLEVLENVRSKGSQIPVILMTSDGRPEVKEGLEKFQNSSFLLKPFRFEELQTKISQAIASVKRGHYRRRSCPNWGPSSSSSVGL